MHFEKAKCLSTYIKFYFFSRKKKLKKICVPTLPKMFGPVIRNTLHFLFGHISQYQPARVENRTNDTGTVNSTYNLIHGFGKV